MLSLRSKAAEAVFFMVGMIVGAGIFTVPYVFSRSGIVFGVLTVILVTIVVLATHLMYADIVLVTGGKHRLIGNARSVLGETAGEWTSLIVVLGSLGALLAYVVLGGVFLFSLFGGITGGGLIMYQFLFLLIGLASLSYGAKLIGKLNTWLTILLIGLFVVLIAATLPRVFVPNLLAYHPTNMFGAYGVVLFSLLGVSAIPEMHSLLGKAPGSLHSTVRIGTLIAAALTLLFGVAVAGFNGPYTTPDAITGLADQLGAWVLMVGGIVGLVAVFTSFIILALNLDETFRLDFNWSRKRALACTFGPVVLAMLLGARDVVEVISFTGTLLGGASCIIIALIYRTLLQQRTHANRMSFGEGVPLVCIIFLVLGMCAQAFM